MSEIKYEDLDGMSVETFASVLERLSNAFGLVLDDINIIESRFCCWQSVLDGHEYANCVWVKFEYSGDLYIASESWDGFDKLEKL